MGVIIREIKIPLNDLYSFISDDEDKEDVLKNLSKINIFVGENNSGKSRFLRSIIVEKDFEFMPSDESLRLLNENVLDLNLPENDIFERLINDLLEVKLKSEGIIDRYTSIKNYSPVSSIINGLKAINGSFLVHEKKDYLDPFIEYKNIITKLKQTRGSTTGNFSHDEIGKAFYNIIGDNLGKWGTIENINLNYKFNKIYIPIMRGLRPLLQQQNYQDLYKERTRDDYFSEYSNDDLKNNNITIFTGLDAYKTVNLYSRLNPEKRELLEDFKEYLKEIFFDGKNIEITASLKENEEPDVLRVKIGDEHEKPIHELGDGIQSIIILTLELFLHKNENLLVFIEEPEQYLHPGLQRKVIETFLHQDGFENFQFFITTHSNHFLDITLDFNDISIFAMKKHLDDSDNTSKVPTFTIENLSQGDTSALELLGVQNSSVFLSNCTIWVEGITDRHYVRHFLELHKKENKDDPEFLDFNEDYHYSFVEYGGNNITHWSFLDKEETPINVEKLCGRLFLIADKDQGKDQRHDQLKETLVGRYYQLKCREIENLVLPELLLKIVKEYEGLGEHEISDNINEEFNYSSYKDRRLGNFIEDKIIINKDEMRRSGYKAISGTIKNKDSFLKKFIKYTTKWDDLSPEAQEITERIYNFIRENNS